MQQNTNLKYLSTYLDIAKSRKEATENILNNIPNELRQKIHHNIYDQLNIKKQTFLSYIYDTADRLHNFKGNYIFQQDKLEIILNNLDIFTQDQNNFTRADSRKISRDCDNAISTKRKRLEIIIKHFSDKKLGCHEGKNLTSIFSSLDSDLELQRYIKLIDGISSIKEFIKNTGLHNSDILKAIDETIPQDNINILDSLYKKKITSSQILSFSQFLQDESMIEALRKENNLSNYIRKATMDWNH